jgi:hypothetical protein
MSALALYDNEVSAIPLFGKFQTNPAGIANNRGEDR